jgi:hypothetical protein
MGVGGLWTNNLWYMATWGLWVAERCGRRATGALLV